MASRLRKLSRPSNVVNLISGTISGSGSSDHQNNDDSKKDPTLGKNKGSISKKTKTFTKSGDDQQKPGEANRQLVQKLTETRKENIRYLQRVYNGECLWLNVVHVQRQLLDELYATPKYSNIAQLFFHLGMSIGAVAVGGHLYVRAIAQLLEEYRHHMAAPTTVKGSRRGLQFTQCNEDSPVVVEIQYHNGAPVYKYLILSQMDGVALDYHETMYALLDMLHAMYHQLSLATAQAGPHLLNAIATIDKRVMSYVISVLTGDLQKLARTMIQGAIKPLQRLRGDQSVEGDAISVVFAQSEQQKEPEDEVVNSSDDDDGESSEADRAKLQDLKQHLAELQDKFDSHSRACVSAAKGVRNCTRQLNSQLMILALLEEQGKLQKITLVSVEEGEEAENLRENFKLLPLRLQHATEQRDYLAVQLATLQARLNAATQAKKPNILKLMKQLAKLEARLDSQQRKRDTHRSFSTPPTQEPTIT